MNELRYNWQQVKEATVMFALCAFLVLLSAIALLIDPLKRAVWKASKWCREKTNKVEALFEEYTR